MQLRFAPNSPCYVGYIGIMENNMETPIVYRDYIGIMEKKMETTILYWVICLAILELAVFVV